MIKELEELINQMDPTTIIIYDFLEGEFILQNKIRITFRYRFNQAVFLAQCDNTYHPIIKTTVDENQDFFDYLKLLTS